jgi:hypothetical protein
MYKNQPLSAPAPQAPFHIRISDPSLSQGSHSVIQSGVNTRCVLTEGRSDDTPKKVHRPNAYIISRQGRGREEL